MEPRKVLAAYYTYPGRGYAFPDIDDISAEIAINPKDNPYLYHDVHRHYVHVVGQSPERTNAVRELEGKMDKRYNNILSYSFSMQDPSWISSWGIKY